MKPGSGQPQAKSKTGHDMHSTSFLAVLIVLMVLFQGACSLIVPTTPPLLPHGLPASPPPPLSPLTSYSTHEVSNLTIRESPVPCFKKVQKIGDGNPHPSCKFHQVTGNLDCNNSHCEASHAEGRTFSWSIGGEAGAESVKGPFAALGFDVSESYDSENSYTCPATSGQKRVCIIAKVSYLEYTAKEVGTDLFGKCYEGKPYIIRAPTKGHRQNFECGFDARCVELDHEVWEHNGKACP